MNNLAPELHDGGSGKGQIIMPPHKLAALHAASPSPEDSLLAAEEALARGQRETANEILNS
jgi:hypothetical protein